MSGVGAWGREVLRALLEAGVEDVEARRRVDDFLLDADAEGQDPAALYGPALPYARSVAHALRSTSGPTLERAPGATVLRLTGVAKSYRGRHVLSGVDLTLRGGEVAAVVGANGSGKSTLLGICAGTVRATSGRVERTRRVGYAPQQHGVSPLLTAAEHFRLLGAVHGMDRGRAVATGSRLSARLGWSPRGGLVAGRLSGGTQQKLNVVLSELSSPDLLLLDEPYQGFDQESYVDFWDQVFAWRDAGAGVLVVTHLLHELDRVDHVLELTTGERP